MNEKKPFIVSHWDDFFLTNKIRSLERRKKTNLYLATIGFLCFGLFGAILMRAPEGSGSGFPMPLAQRAVLMAVATGSVLLVATLVAAFLSRIPPEVTALESALMKGFGAALDASDLNPNKKEPKKPEVRS